MAVVHRGPTLQSVDWQMSMKIEIHTEDVSSDCETCGTNYDSGGSVLIDGEEVFSYSPIAGCWDNMNYGWEQLLVIALRTKGIEILVDGEIPHNCETAIEFEERMKG